MTLEEIVQGLEEIANNWDSGNVTDSTSDAFPESQEQWVAWLRAAIETLGARVGKVTFDAIDVSEQASKIEGRDSDVADPGMAEFGADA